MSPAPATVATPTAFAPNHPGDRNFYLVMAALAWLGIGMGFGQEIIVHIQKHQPAFALIVHVHAIIFVLWLVLFTVQILLIRYKKLALHRRLGFGLVGLAGLMAIIGPATALTVQHAAIGDPDADPGFLAVQFTDILAFVGLTTAAILYRKAPATHKRLILLGTLYITDAGYSRWWADPILHRLGEGFWPFWVALYVGPNVLVLLVGAYDLVTRRRLHPAYLAGVAWIFGNQMLALILYLEMAVSVWPASS